MQVFFQSLSLTSASLLVTVISAVAALLIGRITSAVARWVAAVLFPFVLSYSVYWMPVWLGADGSEYLAWALLGLGVPFLAGFVPSAVVTVVVTRHAQQRVQPCAAANGDGIVTVQGAQSLTDPSSRSL